MPFPQDLSLVTREQKSTPASPLTLVRKLWTAIRSWIRVPEGDCAHNHPMGTQYTCLAARETQGKPKLLSIVNGTNYPTKSLSLCPLPSGPLLTRAGFIRRKPKPTPAAMGAQLDVACCSSSTAVNSSAVCARPSIDVIQRNWKCKLLHWTHSRWLQQKEIQFLQPSSWHWSQGPGWPGTSKAFTCLPSSGLETT